MKDFINVAYSAAGEYVKANPKVAMAVAVAAIVASAFGVAFIQ